MLVQLSLGSALTILTIAVATVVWWMIEMLLKKMRPWALRPPLGLHLMTVLALTLIGTLMMMTVYYEPIMTLITYGKNTYRVGNIHILM